MDLFRFFSLVQNRDSELLLWTRLWTFSFHKWQKIPCVSERLLPSEVHSCFMQFVIWVVKCLANRCRLFFNHLNPTNNSLYHLLSLLRYMAFCHKVHIRYIFCSILTTSLSSINRFIFTVFTDYDLCEVETAVVSGFAKIAKSNN